MACFSSLSLVLFDMRREAVHGPSGLVRAGRYDRRSIMRYAVKLARQATSFAGPWQLRMATALRTAWAYARQQMTTVGQAVVQPAPAPLAAPVRATARPYNGRRPAFQWGSRATTHGW